ncbi:hypothetical protein F941_02413 [Acinetobacter bouvetii DSM 14964 = CIP 107468]|uniref:Radical SAM core domain-containing protein n=1 Tax=Acinetobacter bouvetii DSM 14964 = CIP 107468 TaxID=1120925 RepID=N9DND6_9GAMM|nr:radical SAM protein [Acinetobacter bouvetii]ENV81968.1 hypothetical protein F941_02413 [Acinetobacter bouvetii DSM 14964 = CIP 107468]BCU63992.1 hypothetical protein ACBO_07830 [Acinetobacter bouvetii]
MLNTYFFCISAGQTITRKKKTPFSLKHRYLNYGLLSLATLLKEQNLPAIQIQGLFYSPQRTLQICIDEYNFLDSNYPLFLSIPSFYALDWAKEFINLIYRVKPEQKVIIGGRWVVGDSVENIKKVLPPVDQIIPGLGEIKLPAVLSKYGITFLKKVSEHYQLNYKLLHESHLYQPSFEISRGCGMGCAFCQEKDEKLTPLKPVTQLINELKHFILSNNTNEITPYFETSMFTPNRKWAVQLNEKLKEEGLKIRWRTEGRIDSISPENLLHLSEAGLTVLDLGLESASHQQLISMKKTSNPQVYLERASKLIIKAHEIGIKIKINILLYAGETKKTLQETEDWLEKHKNYIAGVSIGPVTIYGWDEDTTAYMNELILLGASISHTSVGIKYLNLSSEITFENSLEISRQLSKKFMTKENYFFLKSFSYLPRDYKYEDFLIDLEKIENKSDLSFSVI